MSFISWIELFADPHQYRTSNAGRDRGPLDSRKIIIGKLIQPKINESEDNQHPAENPEDPETTGR
jgi:hypothetical protein